MKTGVILPEPVKSLHVLIAEDHPMNQYIIEQTLFNSNINCRIVNNGKEAIDVLRKEHFDLVLMDVEMPVMDGMEATVRIRKMKNKKLSQIPIIAITANAFKEDRQEYLRAGMNDCITKPFTQEQLLSVIAANSSYQPLKESSPAKTASSKKLFDLSYIKSLSPDPSFVDKSLAIFCTNSQELTEQLEHALQTNKIKEITTILHKLKSSAGVAGMQRTRNLILKTELDLKKKKLNKESITNLKKIIADFKECIKAIKDTSYDR
jgi:CheY-like chemotaxis protein